MTTVWQPRGQIDYTSIGQIVVSPAFACDRLVVAVSPAGLHVSHDAGEHWQTSGLGVVGPFISDVAIGPNETIVTTSPAGLFISRDRGTTWDRAGSAESIDSATSGRDDDPAAVSAPDGSRLFAGVAGTGILLSDDRGTTWRQVELTGGAVVVDLVSDAGGIRATLVEGVTLASDDLHRWHEAPLRPDEVVDSPPECGEIIDTATASDGSVAVASRSDDGTCAVWLKTATSEWRKVIAHPESARTVNLAMGSTPRDLFAAIGDSVYRPARLGAALFTREIVDPEGQSEVLALTHCTAESGRTLLAALTPISIVVSGDRGISWSSLPRPDGPPVTAIACRLDAGRIDLLAAQLGGTLQAWPISDLPG